MTKTLLLFLLSITFSSFAQEKSFDKFLFDGYKDYKESTLSVRRVKHAQIQPLINAVRMNSDFQITTLGQSIEGRGYFNAFNRRGRDRYFALVSNAW